MSKDTKVVTPIVKAKLIQIGGWILVFIGIITMIGNLFIGLYLIVGGLVLVKEMNTKIAKELRTTPLAVARQRTVQKIAQRK